MRKGNRLMVFKSAVLIFFSILLIQKSYSQRDYIYKSTSLKDSEIQIFINEPKNCIDGKLFIGLKGNGIEKKYSRSSSVLKLTLTIQQCNSQKYLSKVISINLKDLEKAEVKKGVYTNTKSWFLEVVDWGGIKIIKDDIANPILLDKDDISKCKNILPGNIFLNQEEPLTQGNSITLSLSSDARLCDGYNWVWYKDSCDGIPLKSDKSGQLVHTPERTTVYYVRAENKNIKTDCRSVRVEVKRQEVVKPIVYIPVKISTTYQTPVCVGETVTLRVEGGLEGESKRWVWYENSCGGTVFRENVDRINVSPRKTTTYFVRDLYNKKESNCQSITIQVKPIPQLQTVLVNEGFSRLLLNNGVAQLTACEDQGVSLQVANDNINNLKFSWYVDTNKLPISTGLKLLRTATESTTYFVRGEGECNYKTKFTSVQVNVIKKVLPPTFKDLSTKGNKYTIGLETNDNQSGLVWNWYIGSNCEGASIRQGTILEEHNIKKFGDKLSVRAEQAGCGNSNCFQYTIPQTLDNKGKPYGFINVGLGTPSLSNVNFTIGFGSFYARYKMSLKNNPSTYNITTFSPTQYAITEYPLQNVDYYEYNGLTSIKRTGITGGIILGKAKKKDYQLKVFIGGGIGEYIPMWGVNIVKYSDASNIVPRWGTLISEKSKGIEAEAGIFIKIKKINFMGSFNMINDKENGIYTDGSVGVGLIF